MEINNENKAKFFALHLGQETISSATITPNLISTVLLGQENHSVKLKPLSQITDEEAVKVIMIGLGKDYKEFDGEPVAAVEYYKTSIVFDSNEADYLRSKGYALPFLGLTVEQMIEANWIKLTNSTISTKEKSALNVVKR